MLLAQVPHSKQEAFAARHVSTILAGMTYTQPCQKAMPCPASLCCCQPPRGAAPCCYLLHMLLPGGSEPCPSVHATGWLQTKPGTLRHDLAATTGIFNHCSVSIRRLAALAGPHPTLPGNRMVRALTVIFVAMLGSMMAAHSCAAKMRRGSWRKSVTLTKPLRQKRARRSSASSLVSRRSMSYLQQ